MAGAIYSDAQNYVAQALAVTRHDAGLKQADLAKAIGKHQFYIFDIERDQRRVDILELYVIARALGAEPVELFASITEGPPYLIRV